MHRNKRIHGCNDLLDPLVGVATFFSLPPLSIRDGIVRLLQLTTSFEIDGATQVWDSSARYAQFRAPAFPSSLPCRSRCRALAGLARARTSHDIQPRALCTPSPKSFALTPGPFHPANVAMGNKV